MSEETENTMDHEELLESYVQERIFNHGLGDDDRPGSVRRREYAETLRQEILGRKREKEEVREALRSGFDEAMGKNQKDNL